MEYEPSLAEALFSGIFKSPMSSELSFRLDQALEVTDSLWELVPIVAAAGDQQDERPPVEAADQSAAARRLTSDERTHALTVADAILEMREAADNGQEFDESVVGGLTAREVLADPFGIINRATNVSEQTALVLAMLEHAVSLSPDELFYLRAYIRAKQKSERTPMLLRALFMTAVGTFEPLLTRLVILLLYYGNPEKYESLAAEKLETDARRLCFGGPEKWLHSLVAKLGVTTVTAAIDWKRLASVWEDRNVMAHRGSVTDLQHSTKTEVEPGSVLNPDVDAVRAAIDVIGATRLALVGCVWDHLEPGKGDLAAQTAAFSVWESLRAGRWEQAELLARLGQVVAADPEDRASAQVYRWLAMDMARGPEAIRTKVEAWDTTGLPRIYTVARHVLLRQDEQALAMLRGLLGDGVITQTDIDTWPLFDRLHAEGQLQGLSRDEDAW